ncbi:MAG: 3' terminal RNA ribose 2'-O-methyltransferase Hen1 [Fuerstiella sp.]
MLLTLSTNHPSANDLSFLLHKHPDRFQSFKLSFGKAHVFYPERSDAHCTACLALDVDSIQLAQGRKRTDHSVLAHYVNDRPFVASSFLSTAISQVFGSALAGRCHQYPDLPSKKFPLEVRLDVLPDKGGLPFLERMFQPLGYTVTAEQLALDDAFPDWGNSPYFKVKLSKQGTVSEVLNHLYVLVPVFDNQKHYFSGPDEFEKLLAKGDGWLNHHPEKEIIARRYLKFQPGLARQAVERLTDSSDTPSTETTDLVERANSTHHPEEHDPAKHNPAEHGAIQLNQAETKQVQHIKAMEITRDQKRSTLNDERLDAVFNELTLSHAHRIIDLGCGEGKLLKRLMQSDQFHEIVGLDVSVKALEIAARRLRLDDLPPFQAQRIQLMHGSLMYRDHRLSEFDAAALVEVIEHLDPPRLAAFERVVFEFAKPTTVVVTTPNAEYNVLWENLPAGKFRHSDHRFEWTRQQFQSWTEQIAMRFSYRVELKTIGPVHDQHGSPSQMAVFQRIE